MAWSSIFIPNARPEDFSPSYNKDDWNSKSSSTSSVPSLDALINTVVARINAEAKYISPSYSTTITQLRSQIAGDYNGMTYQQRFQSVVDAGRSALDKLRNDSVSNADFSTFYQRYYFYQPTASDLKSIRDHYYQQDYGFGVEGKSIEKNAALNRAINTGLLPAGTSATYFDQFTSEANRSLLVDRLLKLNGSGSQSIIDPEIIKSSPLESAYALMDLKDKSKLVIDGNGKYQWTNGASWRDLKGFGNGQLLNNYQKLLDSYDSSDAKLNGQTLSQYIASKNKTAFDTLSKAVAEKRQSLDVGLKNLTDAKTIIEATMQNEMDKAVSSIGKEAATSQEKIALLRADAFKQASAQLALQQSSEDNRKSLDLFQQSNTMFQEMAQDLGVKSDFFTERFMQSNITFNWQKWFEDSLRKRYDPNSTDNNLKNLIGTTPEDAQLAANFVQNFLQRRFDASKSLSEFKEYVNPNSPNPVLESSQQDAWKKLATSGFSQLAGDINNPATALGNFWTNLQNLWSKGRQFDSTYYLNQQIKGLTSVADLHENLKLILSIANQKQTTNLSASDLKGLPLKGVNTNSDVELNQQAAIFKQWFETAYANGIDLGDASAFAKLHYITYTKDPTNAILQLDPGRKLLINDTDLLSNTEAQMLNRQAELLVVQASDYATDIQFGKFKTPEEYVSEMMKNSPLYAMSKDGTWDGTGLTDIMSDFITQYTGVISSYAGEAVRAQIREAIANNQKPGQSEIGVDFIQRTKDQALSTIRNLINQDAYGKAVVIDNAPGPAIGESLKDWFSTLGLELVPGDSWENFKKANGIDPSLTYTQWSRNQGGEVDPAVNKPKNQIFWEQWASDNGIKILSSGSSTDPRLTVVVENPNNAWLSWSKRITLDTAKNDAYTAQQLNGAKVSVRSDSFNADWYSKTNPYTKVVDEWNNVVARPSQPIVNTNGKSLGLWAKDSGLSPENAWSQYRTEMQKTQPKFGQDALGNDVSFVTWSQNAGPSEVNRFWSDSTPYWYQYLKDLNVIKSGTADDPSFKTWSDWAIENNIELKRANLSSNQPPPDAFMQLHYSAMGGKAKVDNEYLRTYFPEFKQLEVSGISAGSALANSPFDLSDFGFNDDTSFNAMKPVTSSNRKSVSPIDYAMKQMFGDSLSQDDSDPFADLSAATKIDFGSDIGIKMDTSYNTSTAKKKTNLADFGFGDFGGTSFGF